MKNKLVKQKGSIGLVKLYGDPYCSHAVVNGYDKKTKKWKYAYGAHQSKESAMAQFQEKVEIDCH